MNENPSMKSLLSNFWLRQELKVSLCPSVRPSGTKLSKALNLHLSLIGMSQVSLRSVSGQSQVSLCLFRQTDGA